MAKKLGELIQKAVAAKIDFGDNDIYHIKFKPHDQGKQETEALQSELEDDPTSEATKLKSYEAFCRTVTEWDLKDDDDIPIPLTVEGLSNAKVADSTGVPATLLTDFLLRAYTQHYSIKVAGRRL